VEGQEFRSTQINGVGNTNNLGRDKLVDELKVIAVVIAYFECCKM
jgi:hypothetical protein